MASNDDGSGGALGAGLLLGFLGGALVGAALAGKPSPQAQFEQRLRDRLSANGFGLVSARLGHGAVGPTWIVTVRFPDGSLLTVHAAAANVPPFELALADDIGTRIADALSASAA